MMNSANIDVGNVYSTINTNIPQEVIDKIHEECSYEYKTYDPYGGGNKVNYFSLFNEQTLSYPTGLNNRVCSVIKQLGYKIKVHDNKTHPNVDVEGIIKRMDEFGLALRDYQIDGCLAGIENGSGLFNWATGSGKTVLFVFLLLAYDLPTLILVNRKELMEQIAREISEITGRNVGTIGDGQWNPSKWTVAIVDTLRKGLDSNSIASKIRTEKYLEKVQMFIGDEVHHLGAKSWKDIARACKNASVRFGFSGTCFHPDSEDIFLVAYTGEIISNVTASDLVTQGWLAQPQIYMPRVEFTGNASGYMNWHQTKKLLIRDNQNILDSGVAFVMKMYNEGITCICFAGDDVAYGKKIHDAIIGSGVEFRDIRYMNGRENSEIRRKALNDFKEKRFTILVSTSIYDEGVDVPHTGAGVNFGGGFSEIKTTQRIGRVLRKVKLINSIDVDPLDKQIKYYWDPFNMGNSITIKHSTFRESVYKKQEAFNVYNREFRGFKK